VVLSTGTSLVPDLPFTLLAGDRIQIGIDEVGTLTSHVSRGKDEMAWLGEASEEPARRQSTGSVAPDRAPTPTGRQFR